MNLSESYRKRLMSLSGINPDTLEESSRVDFLKNDFTERVGRKYDRFVKFYDKGIWDENKESDNFIKTVVKKTVFKNNKIVPKDIWIKSILKQFDKLEQYDPTENKQYLTWLINIYLSGNLLEEDMYKIPDTLKLFSKNKDKLPLEQRNINSFTNLSSLYDVVSKYESEEELSASEKEKLVKLEGAEQVYDSPRWKIIIPKTEAAACLYGKSTKWCTAAQGNNMFQRYHKQGPLFILINKSISDDRNKMKKLQFHFQTNQYMDTTDSQIDITKFFKANPELIDFFSKRGDIDTAFKLDHMLVSKEEGLNLLKTTKDILGFMKKKGYKFFEDFFIEIGARKEFENIILHNPEFMKAIFKENLIKDLIQSYLKLGLISEGFKAITTLPWLNEWIVNPNVIADSIEDFIISVVKLGPEGKEFAKKLLDRGGLIWNRFIKTNNIGKYFTMVAHRHTFGQEGVKVVKKMLKDPDVLRELTSKGISKTTLEILNQFYSGVTSEQAEIYLKNIINS